MAPLVTFAVDGGGTACRAVLTCSGGRFEATGGPANASADFAGSVASLRDVLGALVTTAGLTWADLAGARGYLGLAGIMSPEAGRKLAQALGLPSVRVADDQDSTIVGALKDADGVVCAVGTGSFLGRQAAGRIRRIGGHGFHLGDQASGGWLGRRLLQQALLAQDGILDQTALLAAVLARDFGPGGITAFQFRARPAEMAALAPLVVQSDDPAARALMAEGAAYLRAGIAALGWREGQALCLTGGIGPFYAPHLGLDVTPPQGSALDGGLILAARSF